MISATKKTLLRRLVGVSILLVTLMSVTAEETDAQVFLTLNSTDWFNRSRYDHPDHENHQFVALMSSDLLEAMIRKKGLRGFELMITKSCGGGRRSVAYFIQLSTCLKNIKNTMIDSVEELYTVKTDVSIRDHIAVTTFCSVLPKIVNCKKELCSSIQDCDNYTGVLELINTMHDLLVEYYCVNSGLDLMNALSVTSRDCARRLLVTVQDCWGRAGLNYNDVTSVLRRLTKKQTLCQQLIGTQKCLSQQYSAKEGCEGPMADMVLNIGKKIQQNFSCHEFGQEGRHLLGL